MPAIVARRQAERDLAELTGQAAGPVRLAAFQSVMSPLIAPALRILTAAHPAIRPAVTEPRLALGQAPVTACARPPLGGRHIAAWYPAGPAQPAPPTATVLDTLAQAGQAPRQAP